MRLSTALTLALTVLLAMSTVGVTAASPSAPALAPEPAPAVSHGSPLESGAASPTATSLSPAASQAPDSAEFDSQQVIRISISEDGDARWSIESRFVLYDDEDVADFDDHATAVAAGERDVAYDRSLFEYRASEATARTDREMSIEDSGWDEPRVHSLADDPFLDPADIETEDVDADDVDADDVRVGVISYSFTWTNFGAVDDDRIYVGDAFKSDAGVWLSLTDTQRLVIEPPEGYALETPTQLDWTGSYTFAEDELDIVFVRSGGGFDLGFSGWLLGGVALLVVGAGVGSYLLARRYPEADLPEPIDRVPDHVAALGLSGLVGRLRSRTLVGGTDADPNGTQATPGPEPNTDGGSIQSESDAAAEDQTRLEFDEEIEEGVDPELLSDEERVLRMLKQNGGRMKQASIVTETGWSNAKVSQLLSQMDDDGEIEKLRIGRENLITLPEVDPTELD